MFGILAFCKCQNYSELCEFTVVNYVAVGSLCDIMMDVPKGRACILTAQECFHWIDSFDVTCKILVFTVLSFAT